MKIISLGYLALSFAGEDREFAEGLAVELRNFGLKVFYDRHEQANLWGKDLYQHLQAVYRDSSRVCVVFISRHYGEKLWTKHELRQAQARACRDTQWALDASPRAMDALLAGSTWQEGAADP